MKRGIATFTLDHGRCPKWLFDRMVKLGRSMTEVIVAEYGPEEYIQRLADPVWFQSLGTVLAFDWNASGLTTILTAALKEAVRGQEKELGVFIAGGKGATSRKTPDQIAQWGEQIIFPKNQIEALTYTSKMTAKVDNSLLQDGYQLYHHTFFFTNSGAWTVVQQGMNQENGTARRYHWHSNHAQDLINEPHSGVVAPKKLNPLNLTAEKSREARNMSVEMVNSNLKTLTKDITLLRRYCTPLSRTIAIENKHTHEQLSLLELAHTEFCHHPVVHEDFGKSKYLEKILSQVVDHKPQTYEELIAIPGVGPKTVRALALVSEIIYNAKPSYEDPARYSFAHGGKDATPYPVDRPTYDQTIETLKKVVSKTRIDNSEKNKIYQRLQS